jgi:hypothetical protein
MVDAKILVVPVLAAGANSRADNGAQVRLLLVEREYIGEVSHPSKVAARVLHSLRAGLLGGQTAS